MTQHTPVIAAVLLACSFLAPSTAKAGLGPENIIVVVNADSYESRTLANAYVHERDIPSANVIALGGVSAKPRVSLEDFRTKILRPVLSQIESRGLAGQARVIAYSAGFPTSVGIKAHTERLKHPQLKKLQKGIASITGLTYFYRYVLSDNHEYLGLSANLYCRGVFNRHFANPFSDIERRTQFESADRLFRREKYSDAAATFGELFASAPTLAPLAIRTAECYAKAGDRANAKSWIVKAVRAGWTSKTWLAQNEAFAPLMNEPPLSSLTSRLSDAPIEMQEPIGFSSRVAWTPTGHRATNLELGVPYMLSCMLGVVHPRGSSLQQAIEVFKRAKSGDRTYPDAEFWFLISKDVRTKTRILGFEAAKDWLKYLGRKTDSPFGAVPNKQGKVAGMMLGASTLKIDNRKWEFVPGAIADNLTSHGGNYGNAGQTKLNSLLHAGAAMSSGTVFEPYSLQAKFPLPIMYGYYASGVTAMESFYLSVACPYQLLIVGDPLAQPYARSPNDTITMQADPEPAKGTRLVRKPSATQRPSVPAGAMEMYVEGKLVNRMLPVNELKFRLPDAALGAVEIRVSLISRDPIQSRASSVHWVRSGEIAPPVVTPSPNSTTVSVRCDRASSILLSHHNETIGSVDGSSGEFEIDPEKYGGGPVRLRAVAKVDDKSIIGRSVVVQLPVRAKD